MDKKKQESLFSCWKRKPKSSSNVEEDDPVEEDNQNTGLEPDLFNDDDDDLFAQACDESLSLDGDLLRSDRQQPSTSTDIQEYRPLVPESTPLETLPGFDVDNGRTWIYPINYPLRSYQFSIVEKALYNNTLVCLPTGLGKTFIAAVLMYNYYRWYPRSKIIFMAPTKPLVAQQVEACFNIAGMPQEDTSQMTGSMAPASRIQEWTDKRVFFLTPQVLTNDLSRGACPAHQIKCLVLDEAHRALGNHAYCQVVRGLREQHCRFRILALSATPGTDVRSVQQVIQNLLISHIELRSEDSPDIAGYTHQRHIEKIVVPLGAELASIQSRYQNVLRVYVNRLIDMRVVYTRDETTLSKFQILKAREAFRQNPPDNLPRDRYGVAEGMFALCMTLYHAYELLMQHGIRSFYNFLKGTLGGDKGHSMARGELQRNSVFQRLMEDLSKKYDSGKQQSSTLNNSGKEQNSTLNNSGMFAQIGSPQSVKAESTTPYVVSHPKMEELRKIVIKHHQKFLDEGQSTRVMIFSQYRDSVLEITEMLQHHYPLVKAMSFVGQSTVAHGGRGFTQKEQLKVVKEFKEGGFNTLTSTCVGEEGLDIGEVDLIICYDAPKSPIRLVQRIGRTGRKREGRIIILVTKGKEEQMYNQSQLQKKNINKALADGEKLKRFLFPSNDRMVPRGLTPVCHKLHMKIGTWKTKAGKDRKSVSGSKSLTGSLLEKTSLPKKKQHGKVGMLSREEWQWLRDNLWVSPEEVKTIAKPVFMSLKKKEDQKEEEEMSRVNFGVYQPWQTMLQKSHVLGHSMQSRNLVQLTEFIDLQINLAPDDDPYSLEMHAFLDMNYVENKATKAATSKDELPKKKSKMVKGEKKKHTKSKQSNLITDMFSQKARKNEEEMESHQQQDLEDFDIQSEKPKGKEDDSDVEVMIVEDGGMDVDVNQDDGDNVIASPLNKSKENDAKSKEGNEESGNHGEDMEIVEKSKDFTSAFNSISKLVVSVLSVRLLSPIQIITPPNSIPSDEEIEEPLSPTDVIVAVEKWMGNRKKNRYPNSSFFEAGDVDISREVDLLISQTHEIQEAMVIPDSDDGNGYSPLPGYSKIAESLQDISGKDGIAEENTSNTPEKVDESVVEEVSPILPSSYRKPVRPNLKLYSSTPKLNAKRLFKLVTPNLTRIEQECSMSHEMESLEPLPGEKNTTKNLLLNKKSDEDTNMMASVATKPATLLSQRSKVRSKLSKFSVPDDNVSTDSTQDQVFLNEDGSRSGKSVKSNFSKSIENSDVSQETHKLETILTDESVKEIEKIKAESSVKVDANFKKSDGSTESFSASCDDRLVSNCSSNVKTVLESKSELHTKDDISEEPRKITSSLVKEECSVNFNLSFEDDLFLDFDMNDDKPKDNTRQDHNFVFTTPKKSSPLSQIKSSLEQKDRKPFEKSKQNLLSVTQIIDLVDESDEAGDSACSMNISELDKDSNLGQKNLSYCFRAPCKDRVTEKAENTMKGTEERSSKKVIKRNLLGRNGTSSCSINKRLTYPKSEPLIREKDADDVLQELSSTPSTSTNKISYKLQAARKFSSENGMNSSCQTETNSATSSLQPKAEVNLSLENPDSKTTKWETNFSLLDDVACNNYDCSEKEEEKESISKNTVVQDLLGSGDFEPMSESLLADIKLNMIMGKEEKQKKKEVSFSVHVDDKGNNPPVVILSDDDSPVHKERELNKSSTSLLAGSQEATQVWKRQKRKYGQIIDSDNEEEWVNSEKSVIESFRVKGAMSSSSSIRTSSTDSDQKSWKAKNYQSNQDSIVSVEDDDFEDEVSILHPGPRYVNMAEEKKKRIDKRKHNFIHDEAELSEEGERVSSDESEGEHLDKYDESFVDDCTQLSQDAAVDMRAVYLQSVVSPKLANRMNHRAHRAPVVLSDTDEENEDLEDGAGNLFNASRIQGSSFTSTSGSLLNHSGAKPKEDVMKSSASVALPLVLVDSQEISIAGSIASKLRLHKEVNISVAHLAHAHYVVSTRMGVTRQLYSAFTSSQHRGKLIQRVQGMLDIYERSVLIVESDRLKPGETPHNAHSARSKYVDTITCACTHVKRFKVLYSRNQEDTSNILWQLVEQEKNKGYSILVLPSFLLQCQKILNFFKSLPRLSYASAIQLAYNFNTVVDFINSSVATIQEKGCMTYEKAAEIKQYLYRKFRPDMLPPV
ncbi:Fanconi anemia group M protein-like isoform X2 [Penaeus japonicus]|uniref:Fanconi anemia group M protein-like isoform X2 n=1 Tax=Penaeus japonicus TaxID=27405 RepID=UPI001C710269|nr:Fanconi anemia group M protein-like isoform X2 [Penaeus japonicus]